MKPTDDPTSPSRFSRVHRSGIIAGVLLLGLSLASGSGAQQEGNVGKMISLGAVSFSPNYQLGPKNRFIRFTVRNNTQRPIKNLFAWVYRVKKNARGQEFFLVNNPHRGGNRVNGHNHWPQTTADWRFLLTPALPAEEKNITYVLRVRPESIFYKHP